MSAFGDWAGLSFVILCLYSASILCLWAKEMLPSGHRSKSR